MTSRFDLNTAVQARGDGSFVATFDLGNSAMYLTPGTAFDDGRHRTAHL